MLSKKTLDDCDICDGGGSGICTNHVCVDRVQDQAFPITFKPKNPDLRQYKGEQIND